MTPHKPKYRLSEHTATSAARTAKEFAYTSHKAKNFAYTSRTAKDFVYTSHTAKDFA